MTPRLRLDTLDRITPAARPRYDPRDLRVGIVHLGIGGFFRAHAAAYTHDVVTGGDARWGVLGASQRTATVPAAMAPQDGLYTLLVRPTSGPPDARVVGVVRALASAADNPDAVTGRLADPDVHVVTLTVTEKGYRIGPDGHLRHDDEVAADLAGRPPRTVVGQLVRGLQGRVSTGGGPIALVSCDNLTGNGPLLRQLVSDFVERLGDGDAGALMGWIDDHAAFPATMVDRIVPAATDGDRAEVERLIGARDEAAVVTEPFRQWILDDTFTGPRPAWESAGAVFTHDVTAYERVKLRLLNATHSFTAYAGALAGYGTIDGALADPAIERAARALIDRDQIPTVRPPEGLDLGAYRDEVLERFRNPALGHRTIQVAMDGSQKLPQRLLTAIRERREAGALPRIGALVVAVWMRFLTGRADDGKALEVSDPLADRLTPLVDRPAPARQITRELFGVTEVFGRDLVHDDALVDCVAEWFADLRDHGVRATLQAGDL